MATIQARALMIFWAIDHLLLALFTLGRCKPYEMVSSALWALDCQGKFFGKLLRPVVDFLLRPLGPNHCRNSYFWQINLYEGVKS